MNYLPSSTAMQLEEKKQRNNGKRYFCTGYFVHLCSEQEKLNYMIKALPQSYKHIRDLIDVIPEQERTAVAILPNNHRQMSVTASYDYVTIVTVNVIFFCNQWEELLTQKSCSINE